MAKRKRLISQTVPVNQSPAISTSKQWHELSQAEKIERMREVIKSLQIQVNQIDSRQWENQHGVYF